MKKKYGKLLVLVLLVLCTLTGCTKQLMKDNKERVVNEATGQTLTSNILCLPKDEKLLNTYTEYKDKLAVNMDDLVVCEKMPAWKTKYDGIWTQIFVQPLSWCIINLGKLVGNYGVAVILLGLIIRLLLLPVTIKTTKQQQVMKELQPQLNKLEKKYAGKDDKDSMMKKSQEMMALYQKYKINPLSSCLTMLIQLPIFFAFLEAINRTPAIFENSLWKFQLGTTPLFGITHGNYWYILLLVLIIGFTIITFMQSMGATNVNSEQQKQSRMMMIMMMVFIGIASFQLPSAIALYWGIVNIFSVVQTFIIKKVGSK
ncbi:MAG: YidC/Oxa1 family membrane protein insertase [Bacilli bacterium]|nr:YidC/Oxa1 family membrane protein insertase [Bacilli bacterium]